MAFAALDQAGEHRQGRRPAAPSARSASTPSSARSQWGAGGESNPVKNVAKTKLVGGQWRKGDTPTGFDLVIVDNSGNPDVPTGGTMEAIALRP